MLTRRHVLVGGVTGSLALAAGAWPAHAQSFAEFLAGVRAEARRSGVSAPVIDRALLGLQPNAKVLELDRYQPEFTMTWAHYRETRVSDQRIVNGRAAAGRARALLQAVEARFGVSPGVVVGIWGLESNYGSFTGGFNVVEALATLAWNGRRASFFRSELIDALRILDHGDVSFERMRGSYAGAMGQPQFMPSSYLRLAVDFDGDGRRDIWDDTADVLGSIGNYLAHSGWRAGERWGEPVRLPAAFDTGWAGREQRRSVADWARLGIVRRDGGALPPSPLPASIILPDGGGGEAFLAYTNFAAIRRYNPSDYYALAVGLIGDQVVA